MTGFSEVDGRKLVLLALMLSTLLGCTRTPELLAAHVDTPEPAAIEVAIYRIVQEALANVAHHAQASSCVIQLIAGEGIELSICDNGLGLPTVYATGVGLSSMRERATELGGTCHIATAAGGGTRMLVHLPLPKE